MNVPHGLVIEITLVQCGINSQLEARAQALKHEVEHMTSNLKIVLSAVSVAALLASPALAKSRAHKAAPSLANVPADARASAEAYGPAQRVYSPNVYDPTLHSGLTPDRQLGGER
jgi:hypothetical protein